MSFKSFQWHVRDFLSKSGEDIAVVFHECDNNKYAAVFADGTRITGRPSSNTLTVLFGSGHQAMVKV